ncbi:beta-lactamase/transpeptidase-like protein [Xylariaceae sp. FL0016]|nr:beta-lactamase/transpeptidase-like protein [Xylariaceae sp. FL0016]
MLSHRTGLPRHDVSYLGTRAEKPDDARSITRSFRHLEIAAPLRTRYMYNNMMFTAAVHLVEVKTRQPFADFMQQRIFGPLEMNSTVVQPSAAQARGMGDRLSRGYYWESKKRATRNADLQARLKTRGRPSSSTTDETPSQEPEGKSKPQQGGKFHGFPMMDCPEGVGAGSIISSANDFIRWVRALMEHGGSHRIKDDKLTSNPINESIYRGLTRLRTITSPNPSAKKLKPYTSPRFYAAGLEAHWYRGALIIGHDGSIEGFSSRFFFLPEYHFGAVMFGNEDRADAVASVLQWELVDEVLGIPVEERGKERKRKNRKVEKEVEESEGEGHESSDAEDTSNSEDKGKGDTTTSGTQEINEEEGSDARPFPARLPLEAYTGTFSNAGYHTLAVQIDDNGLLFVEATDRSFGFTLTFEENAEGNHVLAAKDVRDGDGQGIVKHFTAHMKYWQNGIYESMPAAFLCRRSESWDDKTKAGFQAVRMGIKFEDELSGLIWFDRI